MKKVYIYIAAMCLAALTGCIKEDLNIAEEVTLEVSLDTREGTQGSSLNQGDKIKDAMVWVFDKNNDYACVGWRTFTAAENTYAQIPLEMHVPVPTCNGSANYRVVAVLNREKWGDLANSFGSGTTYDQLTAAKFANQDLMNSVVSDSPETTGGTPNVMPASHWCDVTVYGKDYKNNQDTPMSNHPDNCAVANLNVFRAVAKTQLFVSKATDDFKLEITGVQVKSAKAPNKGMVLSSVAAADLAAENGNPTATWFGSLDETNDYTASFSQPLTNGTTITTNEDGTTTETASFTPISNPAAATSYQNIYVGSAFLYENPQGWTITQCNEYDGVNEPSDNVKTRGGYYMKVDYKIDGSEKVGYILLPSCVRNHDYHIRLTVHGGGKLELTLQVNEWKEDEVTYNYTEQVTVEGENQLKWTAKASESEANGVNTVTLAAADEGNSTPYAVCEFYISTPEDAEWHAAFVEGAINAFEFVDAGGNGVSTISGAVGAKNDSNQPIKSTIKIRAKQATVPSNTEAFLSIVVVTPDGRTLPTDVLTGGVRQKILQTGSLSQN